jgi:hypothetical protein
MTLRVSGAIGLALCLLWPNSANAQEQAQAHEGASPAAGVELFASIDSDDTDVVKLLGRGLIHADGPDRYLGVAVERVWFSPQGQHTRKDNRFYIDLADKAGDKWLWKARLGTDGHTWLGSVNARAKDWSKEFFLEREIVETPRGVDEGVYYTFLGASVDLPASDRDVFTATAGVQEFTGKNERLHVRGSYVRVLDSKLGLSAQLRARYFHSTAPGEFDYYSPKDFVQVLPVLQMRRFTSTGWMLLGAVGYGTQHSTGDSWQAARLADFRVESPRGARNSRLFAQVQYSNNSLTGAGNYDYVMGRFGLTAGF